MQRLVRTLASFSTAALLAALTAPGLGAQTEPKKPAPPPPEKKQAATATKHVMMAEADLKWGPTPEGLPPGGQLAVIDGDPGKAGLFTIRIKLPDGYMVQPHWHPTDEHLTILSGNLMVGMGSKWDDSALHPLTAGGYSKMPKRTNHFVKTKGETTFQLTAMGPFAITYVNASDDPRKKKTE
jgi:hypothetical protein